MQVKILSVAAVAALVAGSTARADFVVNSAARSVRGHIDHFHFGTSSVANDAETGPTSGAFDHDYLSPPTGDGAWVVQDVQHSVIGSDLISFAAQVGYGHGRQTGSGLLGGSLNADTRFDATFTVTQLTTVHIVGSLTDGPVSTFFPKQVTLSRVGGATIAGVNGFSGGFPPVQLSVDTIVDLTPGQYRLSGQLSISNIDIGQARDVPAQPFSFVSASFVVQIVPAPAGAAVLGALVIPGLRRRR